MYLRKVWCCPRVNKSVEKYKERNDEAWGNDDVGATEQLCAIYTSRTSKGLVDSALQESHFSSFGQSLNLVRNSEFVAPAGLWKTRTLLRLLLVGRIGRAHRQLAAVFRSKEVIDFQREFRPSIHQAWLNYTRRVVVQEVGARWKCVLGSFSAARVEAIDAPVQIID